MVNFFGKQLTNTGISRIETHNLKVCIALL